LPASRVARHSLVSMPCQVPGRACAPAGRERGSRVLDLLRGSTSFPVQATRCSAAPDGAHSAEHALTRGALARATRIPSPPSTCGRELALAARDIVSDGFLHGGFKRRWYEIGKRLLPDNGGTFGSVVRARARPILEIRPIRQQRPIECGRVSGQRV